MALGLYCSSSCSINLEMEATIFHFSTVMLNPMPHKLFPIIFPSATAPRRLRSLQFSTKRNDEGILRNDINLPTKYPKSRSRNRRENLVPEKWREAQAETKVTINVRRKNKKKKKIGEFVPSRDAEAEKKGNEKWRDVDWDEYKASKKAKLRELNPLLLKNPSTFPVKYNRPQPHFNSNRLQPKNPRELLNGKSLEHLMQFFNSANYNPSANITPQGRRKLLTITKEEVFLSNKRTPDLAAATSGKWLPLHTLAACGEYYLLHSLLKHNVDINAVDKDGLTALHKAIGKKQVITNYLLRNSANPFVQDKEGATLMHYAVQTASTQTIELLSFYNVDINLQDNDGWTPLHLAVQTQRPNLVRLLLLKGADKTLRNKDGLTPLELCLYSGQSFQVYVLIKLLKQPQGCL